MLAVGRGPPGAGTARAPTHFARLATHPPRSPRAWLSQRCHGRPNTLGHLAQHWDGEPGLVVAGASRGQAMCSTPSRSHQPPGLSRRAG